MKENKEGVKKGEGEKQINSKITTNKEMSKIKEMDRIQGRKIKKQKEKNNKIKEKM